MIAARQPLWKTATAKPYRQMSKVERLVVDLLYDRYDRILSSQSIFERHCHLREVEMLKSITTADQLEGAE